MESNHDIFISHSSADSKLAFAICHYLEERGIRCWIAPRDVQGGMEYAESIINGIRSCKIMVVLFNENANNSLFVKNEVERAFNYKSIIIPFKVDDTIPSATLELFLGSVHWLDAIKGKAEDYFDLLYQNCARSLGKIPKTENSSKKISLEDISHNLNDKQNNENKHFNSQINDAFQWKIGSYKIKTFDLILFTVLSFGISAFMYFGFNKKSGFMDIKTHLSELSDFSWIPFILGILGLISMFKLISKNH